MSTSTKPLGGLEAEITEARHTISTEAYPMSIGELTNMYRNRELVIRPEFQRYFRWNQLQKSRLVESILLSIPIPSIFVAQRDDGVWEVVDGLQRISTIMELQGELRDEEEQRPPLQLVGTKYLPSLEGRWWHPDFGADALSEAQRLDFKRAKVDIKIIRRDSSPLAKFDLFQRLNSYGSSLNAQELRSALLVAASPDFFAWMERLSTHPSFVNSTGLGDAQIEQRYDLELVTRFLILHNWPDSRLTLSSLRDLPQVLDDASIELAQSYPAGVNELADVFTRTFDLISAHGGEDTFRRWDAARGAFRGSFLITAFEILGLGLGYRVANKLPHRTDLVDMARELWAMRSMQPGFATGRSTEARLLDFIPLGRKLTAP
jgi:hypothetical protein